MLQKFIMLVLLVVPSLASAQFIKSGTPEYKRIVTEQCDEKLFVKCEDPVAMTISKEAFEDSLTNYLKKKQAFKPNASFTVQFLVTKESQIIDIIGLRGTSPDEKFMEALLHFSKLWKPAKQNNHEVCSYVRYDVEVKQDRLWLTIVK